MLAGAEAVAPRDQRVDLVAQGLHSVFETAALGLGVLGDDLLDDDARLVQHDMAEPDAIRDRRALHGDRALQRRLVARQRDRLQLAGCDHLREQHGGRLERLDLLVGVDAPRAVLDDEHAERVAAAQDRHAQEGMVDFFARLRLVGEGRVGLGVGERERLGGCGDEADEALGRAHGSEVHRLSVQALGGVEFEAAVAPHDIDRADLGDHVGGDMDHDLVEARLRAHRLRHDFAEPAQQKARSAECAAHRVVFRWADARMKERAISPTARPIVCRKRAAGDGRGDSPRPYLRDIDRAGEAAGLRGQALSRP